MSTSPAPQVTPVARDVGRTASGDTRREFREPSPPSAPLSSPGIMVGLASKQGARRGVNGGVAPAARMNRFHPRL